MATERARVVALALDTHELSDKIIAARHRLESLVAARASRRDAVSGIVMAYFERIVSELEKSGRSVDAWLMPGARFGDSEKWCVSHTAKKPHEFVVSRLVWGQTFGCVFWTFELADQLPCAPIRRQFSATRGESRGETRWYYARDY